jgi:hypothetical protein
MAEDPEKTTEEQPTAVEQNKDEVLATINGYLSSKKYIYDKMSYSLNAINDQNKYIHSNEPPQNFVDYLMYYYYIDPITSTRKQIRGIPVDSEMHKAIQKYVNDNKKDDEKDYSKKPDVFFISDTKAAYIGEAEPSGGNVGRNYNINYISLGFLIDKILNENIGIQIKPRGSDEYIDVFNFVETPIKIVNSPYLISKNYSVCLLPQLHPYSDGKPGTIKADSNKLASDGNKPKSDSTESGVGEIIYDKSSTGRILWGWKNTIWSMEIEKDQNGKVVGLKEGSIEDNYVNFRCILLNEQWIVKLFNSGSDLGKVLENIVNEIQSAVFGWWQLVLVADNVNNNIKIVDTRGDIRDRINEEIFNFQLYEKRDDDIVKFNSIIREVTIETQMNNTFAISAMYNQNEKKEEDDKNEYAYNLSNSSFNNMWNPKDKIKYSDMFINDVKINKVNYNNVNEKDYSEFEKFYESQFKSTYVAEDK